MAQKLLSISLGTTSAKLAEICKSGKKIQVFSAFDIPISEGLCDDGVILDVEALADELKQYISKHRIKTKKLVFSIASKRIASKEVVIPFVKEKQIKGLVEMNASDYFPVGNIEDYAINYSIIETVNTAENKQYRLNVIATPNELLENYTLLAAAMKCTVEVMDFAGNAILQVLKSQSHSGEVSAILQLGYENTVINVMNGNIQIMQRTVATGFNALISTVADSVGLDEEDAVAFLEDNDIARITGAYPDVKYIVDSLISSIGRIFEYYNGRSADHPITSVRFIGDATSVSGIGDMLSEGLGFSAEEIFKLSNVQVKNRSVTPEFATNFMANIGAVIEPMDLKFDKKSEEEKAKDEKLPWGLVVISFVASVALVGGSFGMYYMAKSERDTYKYQMNSLATMAELESQVVDAENRAKSIEDLYTMTRGSGDYLSRFISDLEKHMPKGMYIVNLTMNEGTVTINANAVGKTGVAKFIQEMKSLEYVQDVKIDYVTEAIEGVTKYDAFTITFNIVPVDEGTENVSEDVEMAGGEE